MQFVNMLSAWQWAVLAAVPAGIVALYFLKLRREPIEVPSTYLWTRSIEDLRVNSLWQRMRQSLLLFLQLLLLAIVAAALLRPYWEGGTLPGGRYIFLVDNSASMNATDVAPSRLDEAKRRVGQLIDEMAAGDTAMIISFSDAARVEQSYTENAQELRRALEAIKPTHRGSSLDEALRLAAGLANPGQAGDKNQEKQVIEPLPATLYILSDGRFPDVHGFSLGNLTPKYVPIGMLYTGNVGITSFTTGRNENHPDQLQAFARLENNGSNEAKASLELFLDGQLVDARQTTINADDSASEVFALGSVDQGVLKLTVSPADALADDNTAWAVINPARRIRVLFVSPGDEPLRRALTVPSAQQWAEVSEIKPDELSAPANKKATASGAFDLVIFDRCGPANGDEGAAKDAKAPAKESDRSQSPMPQANTLFIGALPPLKEWSAGDPVVAPQIIDTDRGHPIMQGLDLGDVDLLEARPLKPPPGSARLIDSNKGPLLAIAPREGFEDAVLGFELLHTDDKGETLANTNWPIKLSFPVFVSNVLQYFGRNQQALATTGFRPGQSVPLRREGSGALAVHTPDGESVDVPQTKQGTASFGRTESLGVYEVREGGKAVDRFAVNLFDGKESDIRTRAEGAVKIGFVDVKAESHWEPARQEIWKVLLLAALGVLVFEWYIYNRRVYL